MEVSEKGVSVPCVAHLSEGILQMSKELQKEEKEDISSTDVSAE